MRLDVGTFTSFENLRDKSPHHNRDINLACVKLDGVLDGFESVLISFGWFVDAPMHNEHSNDVIIVSSILVLLVARMQTKKSSKQICVCTLVFSCLLTFKAFGTTSTTFTVFSKNFSLNLM